MRPQAIDLQIGGMTCASCAARIEKKLNRMPGVEASVNYATDNAHVVLPEGTDAAAAIATVEATVTWLGCPNHRARRRRRRLPTAGTTVTTPRFARFGSG